MLTKIAAIRDDFAFLEDWEDRYRFILELGRALEPLPESSHNDVNKVQGCVSQVWIECEPRTDAEGRSGRPLDPSGRTRDVEVGDG